MEDVREAILKQMDELQKGFSIAGGYFDVIEEGNSEKINSVSENEGHCVRMLSQYVHAALCLALCDMLDKNWHEYCQMEIAKLKYVGHNHFRNFKNVSDWHCDFMRRNNQFHNPNNRVKDRLPPFLSNNLDDAEAINSFCSENIDELTAERFHEYLHENVSVDLVEDMRKELKDNSIIEGHILHENGIKSLSLCTVVK